MQTNNPQPDAGTPVRELDRRVARQLGLQPRIMQEGEYDRLTGDGFAVTGWVLIYDCDELAYEQLEYFSRDMREAMRLVDKSQPCYFELSYSPDRMNWRAEFTPISRMDRMEFADAREPAEAICRAWLAYTATPKPPAAGE